MAPTRTKTLFAVAAAALAVAVGGAATTAEAQQGPDVGDTNLLALACDSIESIAYANGLLLRSCREVAKYPIEISASGNRAEVPVRVKFEGRRFIEIVVKMQRSLWSTQSIG